MNNPVIMEQIAMYMVALPCPPLPVLVNTERYHGFNEEDKEEMNENNEVMCSSHDLLAGLLICAMQRDNKKSNEIRKEKQIKLTQDLISKVISVFKQWNENESEVDKKAMVNHLFNVFQEFTTQYLYSFDDEQAPSLGIRMMGLHDVVIGDKVHKASCSWNVAQDIINSKQDEALMKPIMDKMVFLSEEDRKKTVSVLNEKFKTENRPNEAFISPKRDFVFFEKMSYEDMIIEHCNRLLADHKRSSVIIDINH